MKKIFQFINLTFCVCLQIKSHMEVTHHANPLISTGASHCFLPAYEIFYIYIRTVYSCVYKYSHILKFIPTVVGCLCAVLPSNGFMRQKPIYSPILFLPQITPHPTDYLPTQVAWWSPKRGSRYESNASRTSPPSLTTLNLKTGGPSRLRREDF